MSLRTLLLPGLLAAALTAAPGPASAHFRGGHGGHFHHFCCFSPSRFFLGLNFAFPAWYPPAPYYYYPPPPVVYAPPPAYPAPPPTVTLGRDVGQGCREYTAPVTVGGQVVQGYGVACPRSDGSWQIVN